ncbi:leucine-rich repeat protein [uncultured Draconibacterium sp.]|uniref:leucine-rich repeat protein n=1 Tax=uncultured Draconibacterium sp. TaxID=1573823 RepID=UPI00321723A7
MKKLYALIVLYLHVLPYLLCINRDFVRTGRVKILNLPGLIRHTFFPKFIFGLLLIIYFILGGARISSAQSYTLTDADVVVENGVITNCSNYFSGEAIIIPDFLDGQLVTGIGTAVFNGKMTAITKLELPSSVVYIDAHAFNNIGLDTLDISSCAMLDSIGDYAFYNNNLVELNLEGCSLLSKIGGYAFSQNNIDTLDVSSCSALIVIGSNAFKGNSIRSLNLNSSSLEFIEEQAFSGSQIGVLSLSNCPSLIQIEQSAFYYAGITSIDFSGCSSLESIGENAFYHNLLTEVDFTGCSSLKYIGTSAFSNCSSLQTVNFNDCSSLLEIGLGAFKYTKVGNLDLSNCTALITIGDGAFYNNGSGISALNLGHIQKLTYIGSDAFSGAMSTVKEFELPVSNYGGFQGWEDKNGTVWQAGDTVTTERTQYSAIIYYTLTDDDVVVENGKIVSSVEHFPFLYIDIPDTLDGQTVVGIGQQAFLTRNLSNVVFPTTLQYIEQNAFWDNNLRIVDLSDCSQLTDIGVYAFYNSPGEIILPRPDIAGKIFNYWNVNGTNYPAGSVTTNATCNAVFSYYATFSVNDAGLSPIEGAEVNFYEYGTKLTNGAGIVVYDSVWAGSNIAFSVSATGYDNTEGVVNITDSSIYQNVQLSLEGPSRYTDSLALVALYNATNGSGWTNNDNWLTGPVSSWNGVIVNNNRVTQIWLDLNNLNGSLPATLGQLDKLEIMALGGNGLTGTLPDEFGNLTNLGAMFLWGNQLTGRIPTSFGQLTLLNTLSLNGNELTGNIPSEIALCSNLNEINLDWNNLEGGIPVELCNLQYLNSVNFTANYFDAQSCDAINCLAANGVVFSGDSVQTQKNGLTILDCMSSPDTVLVTFQVNMQNEVVSSNGIHLNGSFFSWAEAIPMILDSAEIYTVTIPLAVGETYTYKFVNGGTFEWDFYEIPPSNCTTGDTHDREIIVAPENTVLDVVCFAACENCPDNSVPYYSISEIQGDGDISPLAGQVVRTKGRITGINEYGFFMQDATGARNGIFIYDPDLAAQLNQGDNIEMIAEVMEYNGKTELLNTQWLDYTDEYIGVSLAYIDVAEINEDYEGVFIALSNVRVIAQNDYLEYIVVSDQGDTTIIDNYLIQPEMEIGTRYNIYGIVDYQYGAYRVNPRAQAGIIAVYGFANNTTDTVRTDNGLFYDSQFDSNYLDNEDETIIFYPLTEGNILRFDFLEFDTEFGYDYLEVFDGVGTESHLIGKYWGTDAINEPITASNPEGALTFHFYSDGSVTSSGWKARITSLEATLVTFQVDMQNELVDETGVFVGGDWNSWMSWNDPVQLTASGDIYAATINIPSWQTISYKFKNGPYWEIVLGDCVVGENADRSLTTPGGTVILDPVCFAKCIACDSVNPNLPLAGIDELQETIANCYGATGEVFVQYTVSGVGTIQDKGILIGSHPNLLYSSTVLSEGSGAGTIPTTIGGLEAGTYYLCAYAENEYGTSYSDVEQFYIAQPDLLELDVEEELDETSVMYSIFGFGGIPPYAYQITLCREDSLCWEYSWQTENYFNIGNLAQLMKYEATIEIKDANGCIASQTSSFTLAPNNSIEMDSLALVALYNASDGPNWTNNTNWLTSPLDTWYGVGIANGRVVSLDLNNNNLVGTLPSRIGKLTAMESFVVWGNGLTGELPAEIGDMINLVTLDLGVNQFFGELPSSFGNLSRLETLFLGSGSQLTGSIPSSLGQLSNLHTLALDGNQFSGSIPGELGLLTQLNYLFLQSNRLSGVIPSSFDALENLNVLYLNHNELSGTIPEGFCALPLGEINLEQNYFHIYSCNVIRCLKENDVVFAGDTLQTQLNGIELTQECMLPSLKTINIIAPELANGVLCYPEPNDPLILRFCNDGIEPVEGVQLFYVLNGDSIDLESYPEIVYPGDTIDYQFMVSADLQPEIYMDHYTLNVYLRWEGGMIGGWRRTQTFDAIKYIPDTPEWTTYNTCTGLPGNISYGIAEDKNDQVWSVANDGAYKFNGFEWEKYTNLDGLADAANQAILTDSRGWTWFSGSGSSAVTRYTGSSFYTMTTDGSYSSCIYEDSNGNIWFGSRYGSGVARLNTSFSWNYYDAAQANLGNNVLSIGEDVNGILYFSSIDGLSVFDGYNWVPIQIPGNDDIIIKIFLDSKGFTWFTTWNKFYRFDGSLYEEISDPEQIIMNCADIVEDLYGNIWFGGGDELVKYDGTSWTKYGPEDGMTAALGGGINSLAVIKGDIWIGTQGGGLSRFDQPYENLGIAGLVSPTRNKYPYYLYCGLSNNEPINVRVFNNGDSPIENARLGYSLDDVTIAIDTLDFVLQPGDTVDYTFTTGADFYHTDLMRTYLLKIFVEEEFGDASDNSISGSLRVDGDFEDAPGWTTYNSCDGLISDISFSITEDSDGNIWSTAFYGADRFNGDEWTPFTAEDGLAENFNWAIDKDKDGNLWFSGSGNPTVTKYDGTDFTVYNLPAVFEECIYTDSQGNVWFGAWDGNGVARFDGQTWTYFMSEEVGFNGNITSIGEDVNGNIWVACNGTSNFVFRFDGASWQQMALPGEADGVYVSEIYYDSNKNTWFASSGLITRYDGVNWTFYANDNDVPGWCDDISEDIYGNIWFGGGRELAMFDGSDWTLYTANEGLAAAQIADIYAVYADTKGNVWIGTYNGGISKFTIPTDEICHTLHFQNGWNIFSSPVQLDSTRMGYNFQTLIDNGTLVKIQDELGNSFEDRGIFGGWDDSEIKGIYPYDGYKINVNTDDSIQVCGTPVTYPYPIYLYAGWNIMGYPHMQSADAMEVVQQLIDRGTLLKVQDETGKSIEDLGVFGGWTNFMGTCNTGKGYKVKVSARDTLWIYESFAKSGLTYTPEAALVHFKTAYTGNGVDHMNFNLVDLPAGLFSAGDELAVFDGTVCVGAVCLLPEHLAKGIVSVPASANDRLGTPGFYEGNTYELVWWSPNKNREELLATELIKGEMVFTKNESVVLSLFKYGISNAGEALFGNMEIRCYPNPFNNELTIQLKLSENATTEIKVVNQFGQEVSSVLHRQALNSGNHQLIWEGTNAGGQKVNPGIYYISIDLNGIQSVRKVVLTQ